MPQFASTTRAAVRLRWGARVRRKSGSARAHPAPAGGPTSCSGAMVPHRRASLHSPRSSRFTLLSFHRSSIRAGGDPRRISVGGAGTPPRAYAVGGGPIKPAPASPHAWGPCPSRSGPASHKKPCARVSRAASARLSRHWRAKAPCSRVRRPASACAYAARPSSAASSGALGSRAKQRALGGAQKAVRRYPRLRQPRGAL